jgi:hypothetical protein
VELLEPVRPDVEEGDPELAHEPLIGAAAGEVHAGLFDIDGDSSGGLDDVGVYERTFRMGDVAEGFEIMLVASGTGNERYGDEARVLLDERIEVMKVDAVVARSDDCDGDALLLELSVHSHGGVVVESIGNNTGVGAETESGAEHVLTAKGARDDVENLGWPDWVVVRNFRLFLQPARPQLGLLCRLPFSYRRA